jgi:hypothetical protein
LRTGVGYDYYYLFSVVPAWVNALPMGRFECLDVQSRVMKIQFWQTPTSLVLSVCVD